MTLPNSDAQPSRFVPRRPQLTPLPHSIPPQAPQALPIPPIAFPSTPPPSASAMASVNQAVHEHAIDFATHSWDLATGGLKTLTAKRELPARPERRVKDTMQDVSAAPRSYMSVLIILGCVVLMLIGVGVVLFVMLQP